METPDSIIPPFDLHQIDPPSGGRRDLAAAAAQYRPEVEGFSNLELIGEGATATVWRAKQCSTGRTVALKLLSGCAVTPQSRERFEREVRLAARLQHPNIARIYDSGAQRGTCFYAMELVDGQTLNEYVQQQGLSQRQVLELMQRVVEAVHYAHQQGVIHRDLKFNNVMVTPDGQPHLLDFGLARSAESSEAEGNARVTRTGVIAGTPAFMSPEQARGEPDRIDVRTDIYSLGVMLYRLVTGKWPHDTSGLPHEVMARVREEEPLRPRAARPDLDGDLEAMLLRALARRPEDRYDSAADLARDLRNYLTGEPLSARKPTVTYFLRKRLRKHLVPALVISAVLVVGMVAALVSFPVVSTLAATSVLLSVTVLSLLEVRRQRDAAVRDRNRVRSLLRVSEALHRQRDLTSLWEAILTEARTLSGADAGSLLLRQVEHLRIAVAQNETLSRRQDRQALRSTLAHATAVPISDQSIAGYVALTGKTVNLHDVRRIPSTVPFSHDPTLDQRSGYETRSVLAVPLTDAAGDVVGVLQLINRRERRRSGVPFPTDLEEIMVSLARHAAVALRHHPASSNVQV